jgi:CO/xanthine dehydrogenase Mo-binding subunit
MNRIVGKSLPRVEGAEKVSGALRYAADTLRPGTLWGKVLRSPYPHALILNIDTRRAKKHPGVKAVITAADVNPRLIGAVLKDMPVLAQDRVRYVGEEIAAVAAIDANIAEEAVHLIDVEYEQLPAVYDPLEAMQANAPVLHSGYGEYQDPRPKRRDRRTFKQWSEPAKVTSSAVSPNRITFSRTVFAPS